MRALIKDGKAGEEEGEEDRLIEKDTRKIKRNRKRYHERAAEDMRAI